MTTTGREDGRLPEIRVGDRTYGPATAPVVVVCVDGSEPAYHQEAIAAGRMPYVGRLSDAGLVLDAECAMPSFTNPNNLSIATGAPPAVHGICGNYLFEPSSGREVMMNDPEYLRTETIFAAYQRAGASVAIITAKDKLRRLLGAGLDGGICFSAEHADTVTLHNGGVEDVLALTGMPLPSVYSADLSRLAMAAGVQVMRTEHPDLMYLSLTDYIQHKHAPGTPEANDFYAMLDEHLEQLDALGCTLVVTADHGMNAKSGADGKPVVRYLQSHLDAWMAELPADASADTAGTGDDTAESARARVILPITDPYTVHHGALGSYAAVHLPSGYPADRTDQLASRLRALPGIELVLARDEACERFALPPDRTGDLVVIGDRGTALGTSEADHDLSGLDAPLRSHGGLAERSVPFIVNRPLRDDALPTTQPLRNYDAFWVGLRLAAALR